ncbi:MAG: GGDEF and EAL domain-containing protein, partial [Burkholderiales bacterium]
MTQLVSDPMFPGDGDAPTDIAPAAAERGSLVPGTVDLRALLDRAPVVILSADEDGNISYANDAACRTLGYTHDAFLKMRIFEIAPHRRADTWAATVVALKQLGSKTFESDWRSADGRIIPVEISATHMTYGSRGYVVIYGTDITVRREAELQALRLAHFDDITGLPNRTLLQDRLRNAASQSLRDGRSITVLAIEIGQLRTVNETLGQAAGDLLLKTLTQRMSIGLRGSDTVAHLGGGEFAVLIARESDVGEAIALPLARGIVDVLSAPVMIQGTNIYVSSTIGATIFPQDGSQPEHILRQAQAALRIAHSQGTNQIGFYTPEANARISTRVAMEASLRRAIDQNDLQLQFQPQIDLSTGHIIGVEALIKWEHPELGLLDPADFLPLAEETGLTLTLGDWVLRTACMTSVAWQCMGLPPIRMAVNLTARQLQQSDIAVRIQSILMETGLSAAHLGIEITESMLVENVD